RASSRPEPGAAARNAVRALSAACGSERPGYGERAPAGGIRGAEIADVVDELGRRAGARRDQSLEVEAGLTRQAQRTLDGERAVEVAQLPGRFGAAAGKGHHVAAQRRRRAAAIFEVVRFDTPLKVRD